jgi:hypothetical protein
MSKYFVFFSLVVFFCIPLGAQASMVFSEVMCNPEGSDTLYEWVTVQNTGSSDIDITGWKFNDGSNHTLNVPPKNGGIGSMIIAAGGEFILARDAEALCASTSCSGSVIDTVMSLGNTEGALTLVDTDGSVQASVSYTIDGGASEGDSCIGTVTVTDDTSTSTSTETGSGGTTNENTEAEIGEVRYRTVLIEPPQDIHARVSAPAYSTVGTYVLFSAEVYNAKGGSVMHPEISWSFGDGGTMSGNSVSHRYEFQGEYMVVVSVKKDDLSDIQRIPISIHEPHVEVLVDDEHSFVEIHNCSTEYTIDVSKWVLKAKYRHFALPENTLILPDARLRMSMDRIDLRTRKKHTITLQDAFKEHVATSTLFVDTMSEEEVVESNLLQGEEEVISLNQSHAETVSEDEIHTEEIYIDTHYGMEQTQDESVMGQAESEDEVLSNDTIVAQTQQLAAVGSAPSAVFGSVTQWFMALLGLLFLASFTLLRFGKEENEALNDGTKQLDADDFEIEEIK